MRYPHHPSPTRGTEASQYVISSRLYEVICASKTVWSHEDALLVLGDVEHNLGVGPVHVLVVEHLLDEHVQVAPVLEPGHHDGIPLTGRVEYREDRRILSQVPLRLHNPSVHDLDADDGHDVVSELGRVYDGHVPLDHPEPLHRPDPVRDRREGNVKLLRYVPEALAGVVVQAP